MEKAIGIYVHFPFCKHKCNYCDFNSYSGLDGLIPSYVTALIQEIKRYLPCCYPVRSIYFGGGTPSYLRPEALLRILDFLREHFQLDYDTEMTIEVNPGTITRDALGQLWQGGFNRLSIGLQASQDRLLQFIGRIHRFSEFLQTFESAREVGFSNISVDLIFGLPGQSHVDWQETLDRVTELNPEHISAYGLQVEENTPLFRMIEAGKVMPLSEEITVQMMGGAMTYLPQQGYIQYEISNYAKTGFQSRHNMGYWLGEPYFGFGAGATSTINSKRWTNLKSPQDYIRAIWEDRDVIEAEEVIHRQTAIIETLMLGLRLRAGVNLSLIREKYDFDLLTCLGDEIQFLKEHQFVTVDRNYLRLTEQAVFISNQVIARLINHL